MKGVDKMMLKESISEIAGNADFNLYRFIRKFL